MMIIAKALDYIRRISAGLASRCRNIYYKALGVKIDGYVWMRRVSIPRNFSQIFLANGVALDEGVTLLAVGDNPDGAKKIAIGENTYINRDTFIDASHQVRIGRHVGIGPRCYITDHDHGTEPNTTILDQPLVSAPTVISDGVWLGAGCIVLKGVTIGKNTVVGAGSVVVRDLPPNIVAEGHPARAVRKR
jgi:acetyltransferase-like isoleucine patch superfamily enzyme